MMPATSWILTIGAYVIPRANHGASSWIPIAVSAAGLGSMVAVIEQNGRTGLKCFRCDDPLKSDVERWETSPVKRGPEALIR
jgi:hypothetical protein